MESLRNYILTNIYCDSDCKCYRRVFFNNSILFYEIPMLIIEHMKQNETDKKQNT